MKNNKHFDKIPKFPHFAYSPSLPALYGLGLTDYEVLVRLIHQINDCIERVNNWNELANELQQYLNDLDDTVKNKVIDEIERLYNNGELQAIISDIINEHIIQLMKEPAKSSTLDFARMFRKVYNVGENNTYDTDSRKYTYTQGCVHFKRGDQTYCAVALKCSNHNNEFRYNNTAKIVIYNMTNHSNVGSVNLTVGHANSLTYDDKTDYLYIAWDYTNNAGNATEYPNKSVSRILVSDIMSDSINSFETATPDVILGYPEKASTIACFDGKLFVGNRNYFCEYDFDNDVVLNTYQLKNDNTLSELSISHVTYVQDMDINDKYIVLLTYLPSRIYLYDKESLNLLYVYDIPNTLNAKMYRCLEPEAITLRNDGSLYLFTGGHMAKKDFNALDMFQVFKQNIYYNNIAPRNTGASDRRGRNVEIFVSNSASGDNPNGDSDNPFSYPQEAVMFMQDNENISRGSIAITGSYGGYPLYVCSEKSIFIYPESNDNQPWIGGLAVEGATNLTIRDCIIGGIGSYAQHNSEYFDLRNNVVCCRNSLLNISNCEIRARYGAENGINGKYMFINYSGDNATTYANFNGSGTFCILTDSTANGRGKLAEETGSNIIN